MLSVSKLSPGQEAYYERSVADGIDDYYAGRGESPGVWVGRGAAELELEGVVEDGQLGRLIAGQHPLTSAQLARIRRRSGSRSSGSTRRPGSPTSRRRRSHRWRATTSSSRRRRASACCTHSATRKFATRSTRRTWPPGRRRSPTWRTGRA